jgi:hypothetical protein
MITLVITPPRYYAKIGVDKTRQYNKGTLYSEADIKGVLGFVVDNIYVVFGDQVFQQSVGIPMGTNCAPLLADLFLYS